MGLKKNNSCRIVLITGASSGFGRACALHLGQKGYRVYGTSRSANNNEPPVTSFSDDSFFRMIHMDVRDHTSVADGVSYVLELRNELMSW